MLMTALAAALVSVCLAASPAQDRPPPTVAIEVRGIDHAAYERLRVGDLYKSLLLRVTQEGLAAVDSGGVAALVLTLSQPEADTLLVVVRSEAGSYEDRVVWRGHGLEDAHLATLHRAITLLREARVHLVAPAVDASPPPPGPAPAPPPVSAFAEGVKLGLGGLWNPGSVSALVDLQAWLGPRTGWWQGALGVTAARALGVDRRLSIFEWEPRAGVGVRAAGDRASLTAVAGLGLWAHHFAFDDGDGPGDRGKRYDFVVDSSVAGGLRVGAGLALGLELRLVLSRVRRVHEDRETGTTLWEATPARLAAALTLAYDAAP
ncbi:MAG: hypothetical protein HY903_08370 [Deltaproteobacteria bacterium]|nr:hypothetical protein [Deltaproteobacteria bacterium]